MSRLDQRHQLACPEAFGVQHLECVQCLEISVEAYIPEVNIPLCLTAHTSVEHLQLLVILE